MIRAEPPILLVEDNPMDVDLTRRAFKRRRIAYPIEVSRTVRRRCSGSNAGKAVNQDRPSYCST